jgi:hypothetical protein
MGTLPYILSCSELFLEESIFRCYRLVPLITLELLIMDAWPAISLNDFCVNAESRQSYSAQPGTGMGQFRTAARITTRYLIDIMLNMILCQM